MPYSSGVLNLDLDIGKRGGAANQDLALIDFTLANAAAVLHVDFTRNQFGFAGTANTALTGPRMHIWPKPPSKRSEMRIQ